LKWLGHSAMVVLPFVMENDHASESSSEWKSTS
jgi:hypothetical protein